MIHRLFHQPRRRASRHSGRAVAAVLLTLVLTPWLAAGPAVAQGPVPFVCNGEAYIVQATDAANPDGQLFRFFQNNLDVFAFSEVGLNAGIEGECEPGEPCNLLVEVNSMGFRKTDGLLYAVELTAGGNNGIIMIDSTPTIFGPFVPPGFPNNVRFDAADVSLSGDRMYINQIGSGLLWVIDLTTMMVLGSPTITGGSGIVNDWAYNPIDGNLYGGDRDGGQVARLRVTDWEMGGMPATITREDLTVDGCMGPPPEGVCVTTGATGLPTGNAGGAFGGAWFDPTGKLFVYRNTCADDLGMQEVCPEDGGMDPDRGKIYEIDLTTFANPRVVRTRIGRDSEGRNDSTACVPTPPFVGAAKEMTAVPTDSLPSTITIQYVFENFGSVSPADDMTALSAIDNLVTIFGMPGTDWTFTSIDSMPMDFANPSFNGDTDTELINQMAPSNDLAAGEVKTITVVIQLLTTANGSEGPPNTFEFCNQVNVQALNSLGQLVGDLSFGGDDPDPDMDSIPSEADPSCFDITIFGEPCLDLDKTGVLDLGADGIATPGDAINYSFDVNNCGDVTLLDISVTDPLVSPIDCSGDNTPPQIASLDPAATEICTGSYTLDQADIDSCAVVNTASAQGMLPTGATFPDPPATDVNNQPIPPVPDIQLIKSGVLDPGADGVPSVGDVINYTVTVENLGNVTLMGVSVTDPIVTPIACPGGNPIPSMAPGAIEMCSGRYVVTQADIDAGQRCNTASVTGTQPTVCGPGTAADDDTICVPLLVGVPEIPTLGHLGLVLLGLGLAGLGTYRLRRRR